MHVYKTDFTYKQYRDGVVTHNIYYGQLVTEETKATVRDKFGAKELSEDYKEDKHLNNTKHRHPIGKRAVGGNTIWDLLPMDNNALLLNKHLGGFNSQSTRVCILKASARAVIMDYRTELLQKRVDDIQGEGVTEAEVIPLDVFNLRYGVQLELHDSSTAIEKALIVKDAEYYYISPDLVDLLSTIRAEGRHDDVVCTLIDELNIYVGTFLH